jgi:hypothetical protein
VENPFHVQEVQNIKERMLPPLVENPFMVAYVPLYSDLPEYEFDAAQGVVAYVPLYYDQIIV